MLTRLATCCLLTSPSAIQRGSVPLLCDAPPPLSDGKASPWRQQEDWALLDAVGAFTVGDGAQAVTFWDALAASNLVLHDRSASECADRMAVISPDTVHGRQPRRLEMWRRLEDGRYLGIEQGRTKNILVSEEGQLADGNRPKYIESSAGRVYELAPMSGYVLAAASELTAEPEAKEEPSKATPFSGQLVAMGTLLFTALAEAAALANGGLFPNFAQFLMVDSVSAADVQAEIMTAMSFAVDEVISEAAGVQDEVLLAMSYASNDALATAADVQAEIVTAMAIASNSM